MINNAEVLLIGFACVMLFIAVATALHAHSIDPPLENEEYLAENPELRELKREMDQDDDE